LSAYNSVCCIIIEMLKNFFRKVFGDVKKEDEKPKTQKQITGEAGEREACRFLIGKGYKIVDRNYEKPWGEIDIVARKGNDWRFVEVKTVCRDSKKVDLNILISEDALARNLVSESGEGSSGFGVDGYEPEDNLHPWKIKRLSRTIETYLSEKGIIEDKNSRWQLDAISVYLEKGSNELLKIEWLEEII